MGKIKLGVIFGGMSTEHDVSIVSATSVIKNLDKQKYEILPIYISREGNWYIYKVPIEKIEVLPIGKRLENIELIENQVNLLKSLDIVFPVLHGLYGEDGSIQGLFELLKIKYVGCKILSSSICMDKIYAKTIFEKAKIKQAKYIYIKVVAKGRKTNDVKQYVYVDQNFEEQTLSIKEITQKVEEKLKFPVFVKPANSGSSVGINKAKDETELKKALEEASLYDSKILIEEEIRGREVECAVLEENNIKASCVGEILPAEEFYTFDAKYKNTQSRVVIPAQISNEKQEEIRKMAIKVFKAVDGTGLARVDFFIQNETEDVYINEINTMPGFTSISMYPKLWEQSGVNYTKLLDKLIENSSN